LEKLGDIGNTDKATPVSVEKSESQVVPGKCDVTLLTGKQWQDVT